MFLISKPTSKALDIGGNSLQWLGDIILKMINAQHRVVRQLDYQYRRELEYLVYFAIFAIGLRLWMYVVESGDVLFEVFVGIGTVLTFFVVYLRYRRRQARQNAQERINNNNIPRQQVEAPLNAPVERMREFLRQSAQQGRIVEELVDLLPRRAFERLQRSNSQCDRSSKFATSLGLGVVEVSHEHIQIDDIEANNRSGNSNSHSPLQSKQPSEDTMLCSICLEEYVDGAILVRLPCRHEYHETCVLQWMGHTDRLRNYCCPLCKQDVALMLAYPIDIENDLIPPEAPQPPLQPAVEETRNEGRIILI